MKPFYFEELLIFISFISLATLLAYLLSSYITKVFNDEKTFLDRIIKPLENLTYKICKIDPNKEQNYKEYLFSILIFSFFCFCFTFAILYFQNYLPFNFEHFPPLKLDAIFNITTSFVTNTNWQSYCPEATLSYFSQMVALTLQNFVSPAIGFTIALALIKAFTNNASSNLGNFWKNLIKTVYYILLPLCILFSGLLISQGVPQNFNPYKKIITLDKSNQTIIGGPIASQEAIKILGTNGGGFTQANSSHPFENPNLITNFLQILSILLIPMSQFFFFGRYIKNIRHSWSIYFAITLFFIISFLICYHYDSIPNRIYKNFNVDISSGNLEGKELRFAGFDSILFATTTTTVANGATNCSHDSLMPLAGLTTMLNIQLGEIIFGGMGSGLYSVILFILLSIFICGLIIGRTPEYLGKKIEGHDMKFLVLALIIFFFSILFFSALSINFPAVTNLIQNKGPHGLSEILYGYSSAVANNGSAFGGLKIDTPWYNITTGICMLTGRFSLIIFIMILAGIISRKPKVADTASFPITGIIFSLVLFGTIFLIGTLTFLPAVVMGPILEHFYEIQKIFF